MAKEEDRWVNAAIAIWERTAPSYVQASARPDALTLHSLYCEGATLEQFNEALEHAFGRKDVTKRNALRYAIGIVRKQIGERQNGAH